jgi:hypothetical protein
MSGQRNKGAVSGSSGILVHNQTLLRAYTCGCTQLSRDGSVPHVLVGKTLYHLSSKSGMFWWLVCVTHEIKAEMEKIMSFVSTWHCLDSPFLFSIVHTCTPVYVFFSYQRIAKTTSTSPLIIYVYMLDAFCRAPHLYLLHQRHSIPPALFHSSLVACPLPGLRVPRI